MKNKISFKTKIKILLPSGLITWGLLFGISLLLKGDWITKLWVTFVMVLFATYVITGLDGSDANCELP